MKLDIPGRHGLVTRSVTTHEHAGETAEMMLTGRTADPDIDDLSDAITSRERPALHRGEAPPT